MTDKTSTEQRLPDFGWQCLAARVLAFLATSPMQAKFCLWLERVMTDVFLISFIFLAAGVIAALIASIAISPILTALHGDVVAVQHSPSSVS